MSQEESTHGQAVRITVQKRGEAAVLTVSGEIDMVTAPDFENHLLKALHDNPSAVVVDLRGVDFLGSAGLSALVAARREAGDGTTVRVVAESVTTARPLQLTGLDQEIPLFATLDEALAG